jgi:hypothetical protein
LGVRRVWRVPELDPDAEVMGVCHLAWNRILRVVGEVHVLIGMPPEEVPAEDEEREAHDVNNYDLLLESDLDPDATRGWGWEDDDTDDD